MTKLSGALRDRWLIELPRGRIIASEFAQEHFDQPEPVEKYAGTTATPRENLHAMEPLSPKYHLNVKGPRADAPDVRSFPSIYAKVSP